MLMIQRQRVFLTGLILCLSSFLISCASYQARVSQARVFLTQGQPMQAAISLEPLASKKGNDQLVYLLDYATALQLAGEYKQSSDMFIKAHDLSALKDYTSISKQASSLLLSEEMVQYKGDHFENLFINVMSAINFVMLEDFELAQVEIRRINEKLEYFKTEQKKEYQQNHFAQYLSALVLEHTKEFDNSYIMYKRVYDRFPNIPYIKEDLTRVSTLARRTQEYQKWKNRFGRKPRLNKNNYRRMGELVLIYQQGWGPKKVPNPSYLKLPTLIPNRSNIKQARMTVYKEGSGDEYKSEKSQNMFSVTQVAMQTHKDQLGGLISKRIAADVTKRVVGHGAAQLLNGGKKDGLGTLLYAGLTVLDRADVRQWSTLPDSLQIARMPLKPGKYTVDLTGLTGSGLEGYQAKNGIEVEIKPGKKSFLNWRTF